MNTSTPKIDRRVQRTRQLLRDALMALIVEKGYDAISVQDITDHANVARPTFYLHYKDKEELLLSSVQEIYDDLAQNHPVVSYEDVPKEDLINQFIDDSDFKHVAEHIHFYDAMLSSKGTPRFIPSILEYCKSNRSGIYINKTIWCFRLNRRTRNFLITSRQDN